MSYQGVAAGEMPSSLYLLAAEANGKSTGMSKLEMDI